MYFGNRRPRGFHHTFRFAKEQGEVVRRLQRGDRPEDIAADSERQFRESNDAPWLSGHQARSKSRAVINPTGCLMLLLVLLLAMAMLFFIR